MRPSEMLQCEFCKATLTEFLEKTGTITQREEELLGLFAVFMELKRNQEKLKVPAFPPGPIHRDLLLDTPIIC